MKKTFIVALLTTVAAAAHAQPTLGIDFVKRGSIVSVASFEAKGRTGSHRVGGTNSHGKGSHYKGGHK